LPRTEPHLFHAAVTDRQHLAVEGRQPFQTDSLFALFL
jgi:hypothetical protein